MDSLLYDFRVGRSIVPLDQQRFIGIFGVCPRWEEKEEKKDEETGHR